MKGHSTIFSIQHEAIMSRHRDFLFNTFSVLKRLFFQETIANPKSTAHHSHAIEITITRKIHKLPKLKVREY